MKIKKDQVLVAGGECHLEEIKEYIKENNLTNDMVKLSKTKETDTIVLRARKEFDLEGE